MNNTAKLISLTFATVATTVLLWLPFFVRLDSFWGIPLEKAGMATIVANYDGPNYIVAAKTLYNPEEIKTQFDFPLEPIYYSAHYPLFPILIRGLATSLPFLGYPYAMIAITLLSSIFATLMFYFLLIQFGLKKQALDDEYDAIAAGLAYISYKKTF